ncbi:LptE family protein [Geobacter sp.]|uniref:LptE family protein n=1 Tax=Geobacter sp. TaxID=46610 RepID=UPI00260DAEF4|nr:LptE family protein [Geobacter sp.]
MRAWLPTALCAMLISGCGYHVAKVNQELAGKTVEIAIFANKSYRPNIEAKVADLLVDEFVRREGGSVVESGGETVIEGTILSYGTTAVSYTAADTVKEYRATMTTEVIIRKRETGRVLWKGTLAATQDFPANDDLVLQQNSEDTAIREICRKLARDVFMHVVEDF